MNSGRALLALVLSLILAWGSLTQAVAHGEMAGHQDVVLCDSTGQGVTVSLGADGKPVVQQPCQHCLAATALAVLADPALPVRPLTLPRAAALADAASQVAAAPAPTHTQPRAPPSLA